MKYTFFIVASGVMLSTSFAWGMFNKGAAASAPHVMRLMRFASTQAQSTGAQQPDISKLERELQQKKEELGYKKNNYIDWELLRDGAAITGGLGFAIVAPVGTHMYTNNLGLSGGLALAEALILWGGSLYFHLKEADVDDCEQHVEQLQRVVAEHQKKRIKQLQKDAHERILDDK